LTGTSGANTIIGGGGADIIKGGGGADILTGGQGSDRFVFAALTDSAPSARDLITDFVPGSDIIDLSAIDANTSTKGNQAFFYGGQNTNAVAHSVTWFEDPVNGNTIVQVDVNGNTTADLQIVLHGTNLNLQMTDFIL
jgi:Ca2+-binding RTX toxin-like protein